MDTSLASKLNAAAKQPRFTKQRGFVGLREMAFVTLLVVVVGLSLEPVNPQPPSKTLIAAQDIAQMLQHTRQQAMQSRSIHGITYDALSSNLTAFKANVSDQIAVNHVLYRPSGEEPYQIKVDRKLKLAAKPFLYRALPAKQATLLFDDHGKPFFVSGQERYALETAQINVGNGEENYTIHIDPTSGNAVVLDDTVAFNLGKYTSLVSLAKP